VVEQKRSQAEFKYIGGVFLRTTAIAAVWFGSIGVVLDAASERVSLDCERDGESVFQCKLSVKKLFSETQINLANREIQQVETRSIFSSYLPTFTRWETEIITDRGNLTFNNYGVASTNPGSNFTDRTNRFISTPQLRTLTVTSEYSFWFKFISQAASGISILCGLFIVPSLYLTAKYGDDPIAHQQVIDRLTDGYSKN
jgi:hypothetical protein